MAPFSEVKEEIAQECLALCRERLPELLAGVPVRGGGYITPEPAMPMGVPTSRPREELET